MGWRWAQRLEKYAHIEQFPKHASVWDHIAADERRTVCCEASHDEVCPHGSGSRSLVAFCRSLPHASRCPSFDVSGMVPVACATSPLLPLLHRAAVSRPMINVYATPRIQQRMKPAHSQTRRVTLDLLFLAHVRADSIRSTLNPRCLRLKYTAPP